ncbi:MAG: hypothetical protein WD382_07710 [Halofilum sp. (in: g-proteobacteria)]
MLAILSRTTATTALTQMIGRVLRQPHARLTDRSALDEAYVFTFDQDVSNAVESVRRGLEDEGMADLASSVKAVDPASGNAHNLRRETIGRRPAFAGLPPIFLPRVLHRDSRTSEGYRPLDYDRDILGEIEWEELQFLSPAKLDLDGEEKLERTRARITLDRKASETGQTVFELEQETIVPEEGLDRPFLVRQLLDVVPNPWQGMRILDETLAALRARGVTEEALYANRLDLVRAIKRDLREQIHTRAEALFRDKLTAGDITLRLTASNDPQLSWKLAETLEI